jgi:hypothetical protein
MLASGGDVQSQSSLDLVVVSSFLESTFLSTSVFPIFYVLMKPLAGISLLRISPLPPCNRADV